MYFFLYSFHPFFLHPLRLLYSSIRIYVNILVSDVVSLRQAHSRTRMLARLEFNNKLMYFSLSFFSLSRSRCCCCFFSS
jgi:hypothetical protein